MANVLKLLSLVSALGVVTGCGTAFDLDAKKNANEIVQESDNALEKEIESDEEAFALSVPVAEKSQKGAIVVEKSIHLPLAYQILPAVYPPPPEKTCAVHAGSHLINLKYSGDFTFSAEVSYPKGLRITLFKNSCKQGEIISVRAGSGFQGLAIVTNKQSTYFKKEVTYVRLPGISEGMEVKDAADAEGPSVLRCVKPILPSDGPQARGCVPVPKPPVNSDACTVRSGRQNIKINATKKLAHISGTAVAAPKIAAGAITGECKFGEKLRVTTGSLGKALGYDIDVPVSLPVEPVILPADIELGKKEDEKL